MSAQTIEQAVAQWQKTGDLAWLREAVDRELGPTRLETLFAAAVREAVAAALVDVQEEIRAAVEAGTRFALDQVYGSQILDAIAAGTREALARPK
jgi:hypothetical protein